MISAIVARSRNGVIGSRNDLPWDLPDDRVYFRDMTRGHTVIMGRKTAESIVSRIGHALPNRKNILITRDKKYELEGFIVMHTLDQALQEAGHDGFIIGGAQIYAQALPYCDRLYITEVDADIAGDARLPELAADEWIRVSTTPHLADDRHAYPFSFIVLDRKKPV